MFRRFAVSICCFFSLLCQAGTITAKSWIVVDNGIISQGENTKEIRSIASITKLMTVMVYIDAYKELNLKMDHNLIQRAIVSSDNRAAAKLCET